MVEDVRYDSEEVEMDVGNDQASKEEQDPQPSVTIAIENDNGKTEPINIDNGRRRPSQRSSYSDHEKVTHSRINSHTEYYTTSKTEYLLHGPFIYLFVEIIICCREQEDQLLIHILMRQKDHAV